MALCSIPGLSWPTSFKGARILPGKRRNEAQRLPNGPPVMITSLSAEDVSDKPMERIEPGSLPDVEPSQLARALEELVERSASDWDVSHTTHSHPLALFKVPWLDKLVPGLEKLAAEYHIGNFVVVRDTGKLMFESMPIYARIGMHLLFYGDLQIDILKNRTVGRLLKDVSVKQGKIYDSPKSIQSIPSFVATYAIKLDELLEPDLKAYKCFNDFFFRRLKAGARPVQNVDDPSGICSAADCRIVVYPTVDLARKFWVKGANFNIPNLLQIPPDSPAAKDFEGGSISIFRLAPQDYHRFHSPIDGVVGDITDIEGQYYTVNPQAINQDFDVLTSNVRSVLYLTHTITGKQIAFVAVGALLVGSVKWTKGAEKGKTVQRGEELGYFAYGGSTVVAVLPKGCIEFDKDLVKNSGKGLETLVKVQFTFDNLSKYNDHLLQVGNSIGRTSSS
uniref:phosphatidylserine decarboxylase n=1 Tax=Moniliophthora roreri TaxID=221103 RepID=A0A0W0EZ36_MONRR